MTKRPLVFSLIVALVLGVILILAKWWTTVIPSIHPISSMTLDARIDEHERAREKKTWDALMATPIAFYGMVVDEKSNPIPEAKVEATFENHIVGNDPIVNAKTDDRGRFHLSGHGLGITIGVSKDGYYRVDASAGNFVYSAAAGKIDSHATPENPAILRLQKMGRSEPLILSGASGKIKGDGTPVGINLRTGEKVAADLGDLVLRFWITDHGQPANSNEPFDWKCQISAPGGGLVVREGKLNFEAPEGGYSLTDEIVMPAANRGAWRGQVEKDYFLKLRDGKFARFTAVITIGGARFFSVMSYVNPSGSRSLEYDPKVQPAGQ